MEYESELQQKRYQNVLNSMKITRRFLVFSAILLSIIIIGLILVWNQLKEGLILTGLTHRPPPFICV